MKTYIILRRGVTRTGKNRVPMADLRAALSTAGRIDVRTYIQSGKVIARYKIGGRAHRLPEISRFRREGGRWYYRDGECPPGKNRE